jgi:hypothetical protein
MEIQTYENTINANEKTHKKNQNKNNWNLNDQYNKAINKKCNNLNTKIKKGKKIPKNPKKNFFFPQFNHFYELK